MTFNFTFNKVFFQKFLHRLKYAKTMIERLMSDASNVASHPSSSRNDGSRPLNARSASAGSRAPMHGGSHLPQSASGSNIQPRR